MTVMDLFAVLAIAGGVALLALVVRSVWRMMVDDLNGREEYEDEHTQGLTPPWLRKKR